MLQNSRSDIPSHLQPSGSCLGLKLGANKVYLIWIGIQLDSRSSQKQICLRFVVDLRVKVNKFWKLGHVLSAIYYNLLSSWIPTLSCKSYDILSVANNEKSLNNLHHAHVWSWRNGGRREWNSHWNSWANRSVNNRRSSSPLEAQNCRNVIILQRLRPAILPSFIQLKICKRYCQGL